MLAALELAVCLRSAVAALLAVAAVFIAARRLAGALATPLGPFPLLAAGGLLAGLAQIARVPAQRGRPWAAGALISLAMAAIAASLSLPGSRAIALLGFWAVIVGEELWAWRSMLPAGRSNSPLPPAVELPAGDDSIGELEPPEPAADVLQQLTLRATTEGGAELSGWLRIRLAAGQRTGSLHVAFCPSFGQVPEVQAEPVSGPDCRIKAAQVLPYGARLDIKLDAPAGQCENVLVWFRAVS